MTAEQFHKHLEGRVAAFCIQTREYFYHVGSSEDLRHPMKESLIANFPLAEAEPAQPPAEQASLFASNTSP